MDSEIERLRKKVENFPSASLYNRLAELLRTAGAGVEADAVCRRCIKEFPRSSQAYVILAEMELKAGRKTEAIALLRTAVEKDPRSYAAHRQLADLAESKEQAVLHLRAILSFKPNDPAVAQRLTELGIQPHSVTGPSGRLTVPVPTSTTQVLRQAVARPGGNRQQILDVLCSEPGVRGAVITDAQGRVLMAKSCGSNEDAAAALSADLARAAAAALATISAPTPSSWSLTCAKGQILSFTRAGSCSVVALADPQVRPAMLELRARQALIDLGAG